LQQLCLCYLLSLSVGPRWNTVAVATACRWRGGWKPHCFLWLSLLKRRHYFTSADVVPKSTKQNLLIDAMKMSKLRRISLDKSMENESRNQLVTKMAKFSKTNQTTALVSRRSADDSLQKNNLAPTSFSNTRRSRVTLADLGPSKTP
jgi:hypothetical protein